MDPADYMRFLFALVFVLGLIGASAWLARRFGIAPGAATGGTRASRRLEIVESLALDAKRRVVILRHDGMEQLILLGESTETLLDTRPAADLPQPAATPAAAQPVQNGEPPAPDDDIFARLRKVADLMNERRALPRPAPGARPARRAAGSRDA